MDGPLFLQSGGNILDEIIVIRAADPDGSLFRAVVDTLRDRSGRRVEVIPLASHVLRIGELEIHHAHRRVLMAGREVQLNHGEYAMLYCMAKVPGRVFTREELYAAAWNETYPYGSNTVDNTIFRLRKKIEPDPKHPVYIKTVFGTGYKLNIPT